jgi:hypothetical protein
MSELNEYQLALKRMESTLLEVLDAPGLLPHLNELFSWDDRDEITCLKQQRKNCNRKFYDILLRKYGANPHNLFLNALTREKYTELRSHLQASLMQVRKNISDNLANFKQTATNAENARKSASSGDAEITPKEHDDHCDVDWSAFEEVQQKKIEHCQACGKLPERADGMTNLVIAICKTCATTIILDSSTWTKSLKRH